MVAPNFETGAIAENQTMINNLQFHGGQLDNSAALFALGSKLSNPLGRVSPVEVAGSRVVPSNQAPLDDTCGKTNLPALPGHAQHEHGHKKMMLREVKYHVQLDCKKPPKGNMAFVKRIPKVRASEQCAYKENLWQNMGEVNMTATTQSKWGYRGQRVIPASPFPMFRCLGDYVIGTLDVYSHTRQLKPGGTVCLELYCETVKDVKSFFVGLAIRHEYFKRVGCMGSKLKKVADHFYFQSTVQQEVPMISRYGLINVMGTKLNLELPKKVEQVKVRISAKGPLAPPKRRHYHICNRSLCVYAEAVGADVSVIHPIEMLWRKKSKKQSISGPPAALADQRHPIDVRAANGRPPLVPKLVTPGGIGPES
jgi:hypothetical protein